MPGRFVAKTMPWKANTLPRVTLAGRFPMTPPDCNRTFRNPLRVALHLHDYAGTIRLGKTRVSLEPGDVTLSPRDGDSTYDLATGGSHLCVHFEPSADSGEPSPGRVLKLPLHYRPGSDGPAMRERFLRIIDHYRRAGHRAGVAAWAAAAALQETLLWLGMRRSERPAVYRSLRAEQALERLLRAVDERMGEPLSVARLTEESGLSPYYVSRLFRQSHGMNLPHYLRLRRVEVARHLLISSDLGVGQIGAEVGIPDPQYFNKVFRRVTGQSPAAYRLERSQERGGD